MKKFEYNIELNHIQYDANKDQIKDMLPGEYHLYPGDVIRLQYTLDVDNHLNISDVTVNDKLLDNFHKLIMLSNEDNPKYKELCEYFSILEDMRSLKENFQVKLNELNHQLQSVEVYESSSSGPPDDEYTIHQH